MRNCADERILENPAMEAAAILKALGEPTRLRLAAILAIRGETCVCKLAGALGEPDFKISRHLAILRAAGLVRARRDGTWMHYRLAEARTRFSRRLYGCLRDCLREDPTVRADLARLERAACAATGGKTT